MYLAPDLQKIEKEKLAEIARKIAQLEEGVAAFKGPHLDVTYGQLQELATQTSMCLDFLVKDVDPYGLHKGERGEVLVHVASLTKALVKKIHKDGKYCEKGCVKVSTPR